MPSAMIFQPPPPKAVLDDPLLAFEALPYRQTFYPLGFPVEIETNNTAVLEAAAISWPEPEIQTTVKPLKLRLGIRTTDSTLCPPQTQTRAQNHLLSIVADSSNSIVCDMLAGFAFGWVTTAALAHTSYFRYCLLDAAVMCMMCVHNMTPLHAACVSLEDRGLLLCGASGAGKSTLAYASARKGFIFTSDDCTYLLRQHNDHKVRGSARHIRFRPASRELFPELAGRALTPRVEGKPSIEVPTAELPILAAEDATISACVLLHRHDAPDVQLVPMPRDEAITLLEQSLFPMPEVRSLQRASLRRMLDVPFYTLHYRDLDTAIDRLRQLITEVPA